MRIIGIIPSKSHSFRLPNKNILILGELELYKHSVEYAKNEGITPLVSTDDENIIKWCIENNIDYCRENVDDSNLCNCINQVLDLYDCDYFAVLQPTSPLREKGLLKSFVEKGTETSIYTANKIKIIGHINNEFKIAYRDQDTATKFLYQFDGNIIYVNAKWYKKNRALFCDKSEYHIQTLPYTLQIDTKEEFDIVNIIYNSIKN